MFDHIRFYTAALAPLGYAVCSHDDSGASFGPPDAPALWFYPAEDSPRSDVHVAIRAGDHAAVKRFHAAGLKAGGRDNGGPELLTDYGATYYAAFLFDPDGNNVEAVCT
ncbi:MAG: VOC family protein [Vulcanimicrobiaceae bacterium]